MNPNWLRVSKSRHCPIFGKPEPPEHHVGRRLWTLRGYGGLEAGVPERAAALSTGRQGRSGMVQVVEPDGGGCVGGCSGATVLLKENTRW